MGAPISQDTVPPELMGTVVPSVPSASMGGKVLLFTTDYLGEGSEVLGRNLMKTFI